MRAESVNCPRKSASNKATSETHVSAMSHRGSRTLQHSKTCGCIYDGDTTSCLGFREQEVNLDEHRIPRIRGLDFTTNGGNTVAYRKKNCNINERLLRQMPQHEDTNVNVTGEAAWSCPRICIDSTKETHQLVSVESDSQAHSEENFSPVIRLSLRKPSHWKWKLTTSASSPAIILPVIRLLDEHGDLLFDTGEKSEPKRRFNSMNVDSNRNGKEVMSALTQRNRSGRSDVCYGNADIQQLNSGIAEDGSVVGGQRDEMTRKVSLGEEHKSVITKRDGPAETVDMRQAGCKTRKAESARSMTGRDSESGGSVKVSRCKGTPRNKAHRRIFDRRRNRGHSSASSDSSPEVGSGTRWGTSDRGRTVFCAGHAPAVVGEMSIGGCFLYIRSAFNGKV
jgi:hypothetical protein